MLLTRQYFQSLFESLKSFPQTKTIVCTDILLRLSYTADNIFTEAILNIIKKIALNQHQKMDAFCNQFLNKFTTQAQNYVIDDQSIVAFMLYYQAYNLPNRNRSFIFDNSNDNIIAFKNNIQYIIDQTIKRTNASIDRESAFLMHCFGKIIHTKTLYQFLTDICNHIIINQQTFMQGNYTNSFNLLIKIAESISYRQKFNNKKGDEQSASILQNSEVAINILFLCFESIIHLVETTYGRSIDDILYQYSIKLNQIDNTIMDSGVEIIQENLSQVSINYSHSNLLEQDTEIIIAIPYVWQKSFIQFNKEMPSTLQFIPEIYFGCAINKQKKSSYTVTDHKLYKYIKNLNSQLQESPHLVICVSNGKNYFAMKHCYSNVMQWFDTLFMYNGEYMYLDIHDSLEALSIQMLYGNSKQKSIEQPAVEDYMKKLSMPKQNSNELNIFSIMFYCANYIESVKYQVKLLCNDENHKIKNCFAQTLLYTTLNFHVSCVLKQHQFKKQAIFCSTQREVLASRILKLLVSLMKMQNCIKVAKCIKMEYQCEIVQLDNVKKLFRKIIYMEYSKKNELQKQYYDTLVQKLAKYSPETKLNAFKQEIKIFLKLLLNNNKEKYQDDGFLKSLSFSESNNYNNSICHIYHYIRLLSEKLKQSDIITRLEDTPWNKWQDFMKIHLKKVGKKTFENKKICFLLSKMASDTMYKISKKVINIQQKDNQIRVKNLFIVYFILNLYIGNPDLHMGNINILQNKESGEFILAGFDFEYSFRQLLNKSNLDDVKAFMPIDLGAFKSFFWETKQDKDSLRLQFQSYIENIHNIMVLNRSEIITRIFKICDDIGISNEEQAYVEDVISYNYNYIERLSKEQQFFQTQLF